jgi:uncharacterized protein with PQ loop repeat
MLTVALDIATTTTTIIRSWPQFFRIYVHKDKAGVSAASWQMVFAMHTIWFCYGIASHIPLLIVVNLLAGVSTGLVVIELTSVRGAFTVLLPTIAFALIINAISVHLLLVMAVTLAILWSIPQLILVFRARHEGVSPWSWTLSAINSLIWIAWGWHTHHPTVIIAHYFIFPTSSVIAILAWQSNKELPETVTP